MEDTSDTTDLSNKKLKKLTKPTQKEAQVTTLILDDNELQRLDNIDSYLKLQKLSAVRNQLLRMYGVCRLHCLHTLNLSHNGILTIEGLKELVNLKWLCLAGNNIKIIEHLNTNVNLEHIDLSENSITNISDLSHIRTLKELFLHNNKINHLRQCDRFLPVSLTTLTLANNNIGDLNEVSQLSHLTNLTNISITNNPCVNMTGGNTGFDYRPFIINWCVNVNVIDGYVVGAIESLRAEWLYSQGRGRHFRVGDQKGLVQYLATVCPLNGETLESEEDRKLRLILSKAQHHQQQLINEQLNPEVMTPSPATRKKFTNAKNSPRLGSARRAKSPDRMSTSCFSPISSISRLAKSPDRMVSSCYVPRGSGGQRARSPDRMSSSLYSPNLSSSRRRRSPERMSASCYSPGVVSAAARISNSPDVMSRSLYSSSSAGRGGGGGVKSPDRMTSSYHSPNLSSRNPDNFPRSEQAVNGYNAAPPPARTAKSPDGTTSSCSSHSNNSASRNSKSPDNNGSSGYNVGHTDTVCQSVEAGLLRQNTITKSSYMHETCLEDIGSPLPAESEMLPVPESLMSPEYRPISFTDSSGGPGAAVTSNRVSSAKIVQPVTRSPKLPRSAPPGRNRTLHTDVRKCHSPSPVRQNKFASNEVTNKKEMLPAPLNVKTSSSNSEEDPGQEYIPRSQTIHFKNDDNQNLPPKLNMSQKVELAATFIQKMWRGYYVRNRNKEVQEIYKKIRASRADRYIRKLASDMETAKLALESERKIQMLQTEAITALWKKVSALEPCLANNQDGDGEATAIDLASGDNAKIVRHLAQTCTVLQTQIQQLQSSMQDIVKVMTVFSQNVSLTNIHPKDNVIATQTEIVAVHTPQGEAAKTFPFQKQSRPSSLPLPVNQRKKENCNSNLPVHPELKQYAGNLAEDVIKTVSEPKIEEVEQDSLDNTTADSAENSLDHSEQEPLLEQCVEQSIP